MRLIPCLFIPCLLAASVHAGLSEWQEAVAADSPRNWYRFDETSGTTLIDHGPGGLNGEYVEVTLNQNGLFGPGQAALFPGDLTLNDLVQFAENWADFTIAGDWTAEFIIYKTEENAAQALFNGPATSVRLEQWNAFAVYGDYRGGVTQYGVADHYLEGTVAPVGEWSHMVFVRSGGQTFIYLNGVHRGSMNAVVDLQMATISRSGVDKLRAVLDEAVVYDRALTSSQVAAHFAATGITPPVVAPTITGQPQPQSVIIGTPNATVSFGVVAIGTLPLEYQWSRNGEAIAGATSETLTLTDVTSADIGTYRVAVSNSGGTEISAEAALSIVAPPFNEGVNQTVLSGFPATFSVNLADIPGYQLVWKKDGAVIAGESGRTLTLVNAAPADSGAYTLEITLGAETVTAGPAQLIVPAVPTATYGNIVRAANPVGYWRLNDPTGSTGAPVDEMGRFGSGQFFGDVEFRVPGALLGDADAAVGFRGNAESKAEVWLSDELSTPRFTVELWARRTGGAGAFTSPLTFRDFTDTYRRGWLFYANTANRWEFRIGDDTVDWVLLEGPPVVDGEWTQLVGTYDGTHVAFYVNGVLIERRAAQYAPINPNDMPLGAALRFGGGATEAEVGSFFFFGPIDEVAVYGEALSAAQVAEHWAAAFSPTIAPVIDLQPQSTEVVMGGTAAFTVAARSGTPVAYQWKKDGSVLDGETSDTLVITGATAAASGSYTVDLINTAGTVTSQAATLAVVGPEATYQATILRDAPVAYWRLNETSGTVAADTMGNHPGTYGSGVILGEPGAIEGEGNTAARFTQAASTFVEVPWSAALNTPQFTFECWAMVTGGTGHRSPVTSRGDGPQQGYIFYADPGNAWQFWTGTGAGWNNLGGATVQNNTWVYLAGTYDGTTKRFFVNGQQVGVNQSVFVPNDADVLRIGAGATEGPGSFFFEGLIDEVAVYNRALSPARILTHYQAARPPVQDIQVTITIDGEEIVIAWEGPATLQATSDLSVAWDSVTGATSPYRASPTGTQMFWRLSNP